MSFAEDTQTDNSAAELPTLDLLEMLGEFDQQDEAWVDNELNTEVNKDSTEESAKQMVTDDE